MVIGTLLGFSSISGCALNGAPSFSIAGAYFPGWMLCGLLGVGVAIISRAVFVTTKLALILPFQLLVCTCLGVLGAVLTWLIWFGR
jgi:hypothetical protein